MDGNAVEEAEALSMSSSTRIPPDGIQPRPTPSLTEA